MREVTAWDGRVFAVGDNVRYKAYVNLPELTGKITDCIDRTLVKVWWNKRNRPEPAPTTEYTDKLEHF